jgi:hypothetical protein
MMMCSVTIFGDLACETSGACWVEMRTVSTRLGLPFEYSIVT